MKIAIIELGNSHDECIYAQIKFLKSVEGVHLTLICNAHLEENLRFFDSVDHKLLIHPRSGIRQWLDIYQLWRLCMAEKFDKIVFNTAQGKTISRLLRFPFPNSTEFYGILHDVKKVSSSHSQVAISKKIKHYFLLNEYLKSAVESTPKQRPSFSVFHPVFFPAYPAAIIDGKKQGEIWICIPGQVELKRRDYKAIFDSIKDYGINEHVKFILLGRCEHRHGDGRFIKEQISLYALQANFMTWDDFIPVELFHGIIKHSDYILPLVHEGDASGKLYQYQISGAYNLAVAYKKPLLLEKGFANGRFDDYETILYEEAAMMKTINLLPAPAVGNAYKHPKWSFDHQSKSYLTFMGL